MPIVVSSGTGKRGEKDAKRHRDKLRGVIREKLPNIIGEESIITERKDGKTIKIPIRGIQIPEFRPKHDGSGGVGVGQGPGGKKDKAGEDPGEHDELETEVPLEELLDMMFQDLGLPNLEEKQLRQIEVQLGWKIKGISRTGPSVLLSPKDTIFQGLSRYYEFLEGLKRETGQDELLCYRALKQAQGIMTDALELLKHPENITDGSDAIEPFPIIATDDRRYHKINESAEQQSNAVLIIMLDVSGSMNDMKKYLVRSMAFWLSEFLRRQYGKLDIRFIIHDVTARLVDEHTAFHTRESGGTKCVSAYELAKTLIETEYPCKAWNIYIWHFSDGEDYPETIEATVDAVRGLLAQVNMLGYGEVQPNRDMMRQIGFGGFGSPDSDLWRALRNSLKLSEANIEGLQILYGATLPFLGVLVTERDHIYPALKQFLKRDRWAK